MAAFGSGRTARRMRASTVPIAKRPLRRAAPAAPGGSARRADRASLDAGVGGRGIGPPIAGTGRSAHRLGGKRARRVEVRAVVHAYAETVHQLAAEPSRDE